MSSIFSSEGQILLPNKAIHKQELLPLYFVCRPQRTVSLECAEMVKCSRDRKTIVSTFHCNIPQSMVHIMSLVTVVFLIASYVAVSVPLPLLHS